MIVLKWSSIIAINYKVDFLWFPIIKFGGNHEISGAMDFKWFISDLTG